MRKQAYSRKMCSLVSGKQAGEQIPFAKAALQQQHRQGTGHGVEFRPGHLPVAVRVDERHRRRLLARPFLHRSVEQVAILKPLFKILQGKTRAGHRSGSSPLHYAGKGVGTANSASAAGEHSAQYSLF